MYLSFLGGRHNYRPAGVSAGITLWRHMLWRTALTALKTFAGRQRRRPRQPWRMAAGMKAHGILSGLHATLPGVWRHTHTCMPLHPWLRHP